MNGPTVGFRGRLTVLLFAASLALFARGQMVLVAQEGGHLGRGLEDLLFVSKFCSVQVVNPVKRTGIMNTNMLKTYLTSNCG